MESRRVTMDDLAGRLRLSKCTISKILNRAFDGFSYSPTTIRRVERMARRLGYQANVHARALRTRRSQLIGLVLPTGRLPFFGALTECLEAELRPEGYQVLAAHSRGNPRAEREIIGSLLARGVDGLLWVPVHSRLEEKTFPLPPLFPVVLMDRPGASSRLPLVATDNRSATRELALRLKQLGHRAVAVFNAPQSDRSMVEREEGLRDVLGKGLFRFNMENDPAAARKAMEKLIASRRRFSALVSLSEALSLGALAGLRDANWEIPDQISFAAFDDFPLAEHWTPPITAIRQDVPTLAKRATGLLLERIRNPMAPARKERIPPSLEWRGSVTPPVDGAFSRIAEKRLRVSV